MQNALKGTNQSDRSREENTKLELFEVVNNNFDAVR